MTYIPGGQVIVNLQYESTTIPAPYATYSFNLATTPYNQLYFTCLIQNPGDPTVLPIIPLAQTKGIFAADTASTITGTINSDIDAISAGTITGNISDEVIETDVGTPTVQVLFQHLSYQSNMKVPLISRTATDYIADGILKYEKYPTKLYKDVTDIDFSGIVIYGNIPIQSNFMMISLLTLDAPQLPLSTYIQYQFTVSTKMV